MKADFIKGAIASLDLRPTARKILSEKSTLITSKLDRLKVKYVDVINGKTKNAMTSDYLTIIREETNKYLTSKGYDHSAIGDNYIEEAPADIEVVKANAKICHDLLMTANESSSEFRAFTDEICRRSYAMIDAWIADVELVLSQELNEPVIPRDSFIERVMDILESDTASKNRDVYNSLVQDILYCQRMRELENAEKTDSLDIVPISGLVFSRVTRMEKECLTVIDIWANKKHKQEMAAAAAAAKNDDVIKGGEEEEKDEEKKKKDDAEDKEIKEEKKKEEGCEENDDGMPSHSEPDEEKEEEKEEKKDKEKEEEKEKEEKDKDKEEGEKDKGEEVKELEGQGESKDKDS